MTKLSIAALAACISLVTSSAASAQSWAAEMNGVHADDRSGAELGVGVNLVAHGFRLTPIAGAFLYRADDSRFREERLSNGNTVCRDHSNGHFAKKSECDDIATKAYGKLEVGYRIKSVELFGGVRVSDDTAPYGGVAAYVSEKLALKAFGGKDYYGGGLSFVF